MTKPRAIAAQPLAVDAAAAEKLSRRVGVDPARTESYRSGYARLLRLCYLLSAVIFLLTAVLLYALFFHRPSDRYVAQTSQDSVSQLVGLERPYITQQALFDWAADAASQVLTFGFNDYDQRLTASRDRFTPEGWVSFAVEMNKSALFQTVVSAQQLMTAVPRGMPLLMFEGLSEGRYTWIVEIPMMVTVRSGSLSRSISQTVRLIIVPVPTADNPMGIAVDRWISF